MDYGAPPAGSSRVAERELLLKQIADQLGFKSEEHFSREFKRFFGIPPRAYQRKLRKAFDSSRK
jgi:AraC-like DNA-binding protein